MPVHLTCLTCGDPFTVYPSRVRRRPVLYCSQACKYGALQGRPAAVVDRFWSKVDKSGDCWLWMGAKDPDGYGQVWRKHRPSPASHRAYALTYGPIPDGLWVLHKCDNPPCVRPNHLFLGTVQDNTADMIEKGRARHPGNFGQKNGSTRLTEDMVRAIRATYADGNVAQQRLANEYGVSRRTIGLIVSRETWQHVT